jgi:hypothetical protein
MIARDTYGPSGDVKDPVRLRALNEIQHRITGLLVALMEGDDNPYPDDAIAAAFFGEREDKHLARLLAFTFERVSRTLSRDGEHEGNY